MGLAMQLTNILRDVKEDAERGRIYIPQDEMSRFKYTEAELERGSLNDEFQVANGVPSRASTALF